MAEMIVHMWRRFLQLILRLWNALTEPTSAVIGRDARRQSRMLNGMLVVLIGLGLYIGIVNVLFQSGNQSLTDRDTQLVLALLAAMGVGWYYSRTPHYKTVAGGVVIAVNLAILWLTVPDDNVNDLNLQVYLVVPVLLCSIWFSWRSAFALVAFDAVALSAYPFLFDNTHSEDIWLGFFLSTSLIIVLAMANQARVERFRQQELRAAKERYQHLVEMTPVPIGVHVDGMLAYINPAGVQLFGAQSAADVVGKPVEALLEPGSGEFPIPRAGEVSDEERPVSRRRARFVRMDGQAIDVEMSSVPFIFDGENGTQLVVHDVSQWIRAENALRRSEAQHRALVDAIPDLIFQLDENGVFTGYRDPGAGLNMPPEAFLGRKLEDIMPQLAPQAMAALRRALATGQTQTYEYPLEFEGKLYHYEARMVASNESEVVAIVRDITERKRQDNALRESEARTRAILVAIPDIMFRFNREGIVVSVHAEGQEASLLTDASEIVGRRVEDQVPEVYGRQLRAAINRALDTGEIQQLEYQLEMADGLRDFEGRVTASGPDDVLYIVRDITERKRSEYALRASEAQNRAILQAIPDLLFRISRDGVYLDVKAQGKEQFLVTSPGQIIGSTIDKHVSPDHAQWLREAINNTLETGEVQAVEYRLQVAGGLRDFEGRVVQSSQEDVLYIVRDITERKRAERALRTSEVQNRAILAAIPDLIFEFDRSGFVVDVKAEGSEHLLMVPVEDVKGHSLAEFNSPAMMAETIVRIENALAGEMQVWEYDLDLPQGRVGFEARMVASGDDRVITIVRDVTVRKRNEEALRRRDDILEALAKVSGLLLKATDLDSVMPEVLASLGQAAKMSRAYLFAHHHDEQGQLVASWRYGWGAPGVELHGASLQNLPVELFFPAWRRRLSRGDTVTGLVRDFAEPVRSDMQALGVKTLVLVPVFIEDQWWGVLGFEDCETERKLLSVEVEALRSAANDMGAGILRWRVSAEEREQRALSDALRGVATILTATVDLDAVIARLLESLAQVVGYDAANIMQVDLETARVRVIGFHGYAERGSEQYMRELDLSLDNPVYNFRERSLATEPWISNDIHALDWWHITPETEWIRAFATVPIRAKGNLLGFLNLDSATPGVFTEKHAGRLKAFADQAAIGLYNAQLFAAEREQHALAEAIRETITAMSRSLEPDNVLDLIFENIGRVVPHDAANIMLIDGKQMRVSRARGYDERGSGDFVRDLKVSVKEWENMRSVLETGIPSIINDTRTDPRWIYNEAVSWIRSNITAPIRVESSFIGVLVLDSENPHSFTLRQAEMLGVFADQAAVALNNAHLYDELRRYADELAVLYRGTSFLFSALPLVSTVTDLGEQIVQTVVRTFKRVDCGLVVLEKETGSLITLGRAGDYRIRSAHALQREGPGLIPTVVRSGKTLYAPDVNEDQRYIEGDPRTRSELVVPLKTANGVLGALDLQSTEPDAFTTHDVHVLTAFGERVAAAIENRQLYAEIQDHADRLEQRVAERTADLRVRNAVAETLSSSLDTRAMLSGVLQTIIDQLELAGGAVYLLDGNNVSLQLATFQGVEEHALSEVTGIVPGKNHEHLLDEWTSLPQVQLRSGFDQTDEIRVSAVLTVVIWHQEQVKGVIALIDAEPRSWDIEARRMIDAIGRQIGVALANAQLYLEAVRGEARIRAILQSAADGILVFDQNQQPVLLNPAAEALFAFYPEVAGGTLRAARLLWDWVQSRGGDDAPETIEFSLPLQPLAGGSPHLKAWCGTKDCMQANREDVHWPCWLTAGVSAKETTVACPVPQQIPLRTLQARSAAVHNVSGEVSGTVIVLHDVTYYRELDELKGRFVSTVSHELRTPLSAILLEASTLSKYYDRLDEQERRHIIGQLHNQANVLKQLIEEILELSRFDAQRAMPHKQWFDLAASSRDLIDSMRSVTREKDLLVDITRLNETQNFYGDQGQLMRALRNLFSNAVKYTSDGGSITVGLAREEDTLRLWVSDTGIGISLDEQVHVFDPFFRATDAPDHASGTGLGLAITREIVELHDGRIDLLSAPGQGSTFTITLPAAREHEEYSEI